MPLDRVRRDPFPAYARDGRDRAGGREVPIVVEQLFDDVDVGDLDGVSLDEYRAWKRAHERAEPFPNGESLDAAAVRYGRALEWLLARPEQAVLVVAHEIPIRYALNAAEGSADPDAPYRRIANATPYLFGERRLAEAAERLTSGRRASAGCSVVAGATPIAVVGRLDRDARQACGRASAACTTSSRRAA